MNLHPDPQVYFIRPVGAEGPIKVGHSIHAKQRLQECMKWSPITLEIAALLPVADDQYGYSQARASNTLERRFHLRYAAYRLHHEWFAVHPLIVADIEAINAGTFDVECLPEWQKIDNAFMRRTDARFPCRVGRSVVESAAPVFPDGS